MLHHIIRWNTFTGASVTLEKIKIPQVVISGTDVTLQCVFNYTTANIYVIKWYKDDEEFYRFHPTSKAGNSIIKTFNTPGVNLDVS